jgi:hypothetical protein
MRIRETQIRCSSADGRSWLCRGALLVHAALCALWVPLGLWVTPRRPLQLGQVPTANAHAFAADDMTAAALELCLLSCKGRDTSG